MPRRRACWMPSRATVAACSRRPAASNASEWLRIARSRTITSPACVGEANRRLQLGEPGVGVAEVDEGATQGGAGGGLLGAGADLGGDGDRLLRQPPGLREAGHQHQQLRERAEHPRPLRRRLGRHQPHRLLLLDERGRVGERAQAARQLLVEQPGPLRLTRLVDQRQGLADQLRGAGGVAGRIGRLRAARQQRHPVHAGALGGVRHLVPQREDALQLQLGLGEGVHLLGRGGGRGRWRLRARGWSPAADQWWASRAARLAGGSPASRPASRAPASAVCRRTRSPGSSSA